MGQRIREYMLGDEFNTRDQQKMFRERAMERVKEECGDNCTIEEVCEDTVMEAVGTLVPARRRRVYKLKVTMIEDNMENLTIKATFQIDEEEVHALQEALTYAIQNEDNAFSRLSMSSHAQAVLDCFDRHFHR